MITTRARGLAHLHAGVTTLGVGICFWAYAEVVLRFVPVIRLTREVNLVPYLLCVVGALVLSIRGLSPLIGRFHRLELVEAARLAGRQVALMALLIFTMMFATQDRSISRLFLGTWLVWCWLGLTAMHLWLPSRLARVVFPRDDHLPTVFVGGIMALDGLGEWIAHKEPLGVRGLGLLSDDDPPSDPTLLPMPWLGRTGDLPRVLQERTVAQVVLLQLPATDEEARRTIELCQEHGCRLLIHNDLAERYTHPLVPTVEDGRHFYTLREEPLEDPINRIIKRAFDLAIALPVVVLVLPPLCAAVWLMQRRQAPGPLFYVRERRGQHGEVFRMLKFRSMRVGPEDAAAESRQARADDARILPFGRMLRRRSLDEFPQFWNVLCGHMSVVGPRPYMPLLDEEFRRQARGYRTRHLVKPGITGLAQSLGYRGEILGPDMLKRRVYWDVFYIGHWSVGLDLQIIVRTVWQMIRPPKTAY
jgi:exopolysaccharide biosynthesis polyprenyl glycosylphosphotransferase